MQDKDVRSRGSIYLRRLKSVDIREAKRKLRIKYDYFRRESNPPRSMSLLLKHPEGNPHTIDRPMSKAMAKYVKRMKKQSRATPRGDKPRGGHGDCTVKG